MTDNAIIRGIRENSPAVWRELYFSVKGGIRSRIEPMLKNVRHLSFDDLFEDACITLMEHVKDGTLTEGDDTNLSGYLFTICWRAALRQGERALRPKEPEKAESRMNGKPVLVEPHQEDGPSPGEMLEDEKEMLEFLDRVFQSIPADCRQLLKRFYWDKMSMKDIAPTLGLKNENVAKTKKNRCMDKFKDIANAMLADDGKAEAAIRRTVERNALRDLLQDLRQEEAGDLALAALKDKKKKK